MTSRITLTRKAVDDVLGGDEMWKHADATTGAHGVTPTKVQKLQLNALLFPQPPATSAIMIVHIFINFKFARQTNL